MRPCVLAAALSAVLLSAAGQARSEAFRLKDGSIILGEVVSRGDSGLVIKTRHLGEVRVDPGDLSCTGEAALAAASCSVERVMSDPETNQLLFLSTAYTPPRGSGSFGDMELLFMNVGYVPTGSTELRAGFLFPVSSESQLLTGGFKQRLFLSDSGHAALAVEGTIVQPVGDYNSRTDRILGITLVGSQRTETNVGPFKDGFGLHGSLGYQWKKLVPRDEWDGFEEHWKGQVSVGLGSEIRLTRHVKLIVEYLNNVPYDYLSDDDVEGIFTFGLRMHGAKLAANLAGIRPITSDDLGSFVAFPLLTISYRIGN